MRGSRMLLLGIPAACYSLYFLHHRDKLFGTDIGLSNLEANEKPLQLEQVQILFRHGARTPIKQNEDFDKFANLDPVFWNESLMKVLPCVDIDYSIKSADGGEAPRPAPYTKALLGGCFGGALTTVGQLEAHWFGRWLASEYVTKHSFISKTYNTNDVYMRSTISKRALKTAVGVMAGLYGRENLSQPVLIHSVPWSKETTAPNYNGCAKVMQRFLHHWYEIKDGQEEINAMMGLKEGNRPFNFIEIYDIIRCRRHHGLHVPDYLLEVEEDLSERAMALQLVILGSKHVAELKNSIGYFVQTICCRIEEAVEGSHERKMILYSSHDTAIISFLLALGVFDGRWPRFLANVAIELYRGRDGERFVRVLYNGEAVTLDDELGGELMPLEKFMKRLERYRVLNWDDDCNGLRFPRPYDTRSYV